MPVIIEKEDLRRIKTRRALYASLLSLLGSRRFEEVTVTDICEEALISRATFYTYFLDKYDLLKCWLIDLRSKNMNNDSSFDQIAKVVNQFINENESVMRNLVYGADNETTAIIFDFILSTLNLPLEGNNGGGINAKNVVLSNFCAGGMFFYLLWQIKNRFPADLQMMNIYLYEIIGKFQQWELEGK